MSKVLMWTMRYGIEEVDEYESLAEAVQSDEEGDWLLIGYEVVGGEDAGWHGRDHPEVLRLLAEAARKREQWASTRAEHPNVAKVLIRPPAESGLTDAVEWGGYPTREEADAAAVELDLPEERVIVQAISNTVGLP